MKKEKFSFGIIGCGAIAGVHAKAMRYWQRPMTASEQEKNNF